MLWSSPEKTREPYFGDRKRIKRCGSCSACQSQATGRRAWVARKPDQMDRLIVESAPTGADLQEALHADMSRHRRLREKERTVSPGPAEPTGPAKIENLATARCILECVAAMNFRFGQSTVAAVLRGSLSKPIKRWKLDQTIHHGKLSYLKQAEVNQSLALLIQSGYLAIQKSKQVYPLVGLTEKGWKLIKG